MGTIKKNLSAIALLFIATLSSVLFQGFEFPISNNVFHVPLVLDYLSSAEGPHDVFHQSLTRFVSGFWLAIAPLVTEENILPVFFVIHLLVRLLSVLLLWKLLERLSAPPLISVFLLGSTLFFDTYLGGSPLGRNVVFPSYLTHSEVVTVFVFGAWLAATYRAFLTAAALLGVAFNINAFVAAWGGLATGLAMLWVLRERGILSILGKTTQMVVVFFLFAAPTLFWIVNAIQSVVPHAPFSSRHFWRQYYPHHTFVDTQWPRALLMVGYGVATLLAFWRGSRYWYPARREVVGVLVFTCIGIVALGTLLPYLTDSHLLLTLFPLRMDTYVMFLLGLALIAWTLESIANDDSTNLTWAIAAWLSLINGNLLLLLAALTLGVQRGGNNRSVIAGSLLVAGAGALPWFFGQPPVSFQGGWALSGAVLLVQVGVIGLLAGRDEEDPWSVALLVLLSGAGILIVDEYSMAAAFLAATYLLAGISLNLEGKRPHAVAGASLLYLVALSHSPIPLVGAVVLATIVGTLLFTLPKRISGFPSALLRTESVFIALFCAFVVTGYASYAIRGGLSKDPIGSAERIEVQLWARKNTPPHTLFLPVRVDGFTTLSRRPVWIDWKIGSMAVWAPETYQLWSDRYNRLRRVDTIDAAIELATNEGIEYIVLSKEKFPTTRLKRYCIAFENSGYAIVRITDPKEPKAGCFHPTMPAGNPVGPS